MIDSLLDVTAYFYDIGDEFDYCNEVDESRYMSAFLEENPEDFLDNVPTQEEYDKWKASNSEVFKGFGPVDDGPKSKVKKPFILFDIGTVYIQPLACEHGSGTSEHISSIGLVDTLEGYEDAFCEYAHEVRNECIEFEKNKFGNEYSMLAVKPEYKEKKIKMVNFLLATEYNCTRCSYEYEEYDCEVIIIGRVDISKIEVVKPKEAVKRE